MPLRLTRQVLAVWREDPVKQSQTKQLCKFATDQTLQGSDCAGAAAMSHPIVIVTV